MGSARLSCELTLFKKDMTRFWPLWTAYTILWLILIPLQILSQAERLSARYGELGMTGWAGDTAMQAVFNGEGVMIAAVYGVLCAMAVWSYLYNSRSANMMHALPMRREEHFAAHFLSGFSFFTLPHLAVLVLAALAGLATGSRGDLPWLAAAMGCQTLLCLFFFCFATLCAMVTGHILALPAFYVIFNGLAFGLCRLLDWVVEELLFGVTGSLSSSGPVEWLTPVANLYGSRLGFQFKYLWSEDYGLDGFARSVFGIPEEGVAVTREAAGAPVLAGYATVGLVLAALALLLYRRRHLESAGDVVAVPWLRPVFQYAVAFCAGLAGAAVVYSWVLNLEGKELLILLLALWTAIGFFVARMLLQKSLHVFRSGWKGCAAAVGVVLLLCLCVELDLFGVERRVPAADQVAEVYVRFNGTAPYDEGSWRSVDMDDPVFIEKVLALHRAVVDAREEQEELDGELPNRRYWDEGWTQQFLNLSYTLTDGSFLERRYPTLWLSEAELNDPASLTHAFDVVANDRTLVEKQYGLDEVDPSLVTKVTVDDLTDPQGGVVTAELSSPLSGYYDSERQVYADYDYNLTSSQETVNTPMAVAWPGGAAMDAAEEDGTRKLSVTQAQVAALWQAVLDDFRAGTLGVRYLFDTSEAREANTCINDMTVYWQERDTDKDGTTYYYERTLDITLTPQAANTLAMLEELGALDGGLTVTANDGRTVYPR